MQRNAKHFFQAELALKVSMTNPHISNIERGKTKVILPTLIEIARALDTTLDEWVYCKRIVEGIMADMPRNVIVYCSQSGEDLLLEMIL